VESAIERSSGNVFEDVGFTRREAVSLELRSFLAFRLEEFIQSERLTQHQAAAFFGVSQPRISNLVRGRIELFSLDTLVDMLTRAGVRIEVFLQPGNRRPDGGTRPTSDVAANRPGRTREERPPLPKSNMLSILK
jgi:predicted XRE-type DNA-binding protein